jgi:hypothetical protein
MSRTFHVFENFGLPRVIRHYDPAIGIGDVVKLHPSGPPCLVVDQSENGEICILAFRGKGSNQVFECSARANQLILEKRAARA